MATDLDNLKATKSALIKSLADETAYEAAHGPRPSYSLEGKNYSWTEWRDARMRQIEAINKLIQAEEPFIIRSQGRC